MILIEKIRRLLEKELGQNSQKFFVGTLGLGAFYVAAKALTAGGQILAGRLLGPAQFGMVNIVIAAAGFIGIPLAGLVPGMVKFGAMEERQDRQADVVSMGLWLGLAPGILFCALFYIFRSPLAAFLRVSQTLYLWSLAYAIGVAFYAAVSSISQATARFRERGLLEFIYGASTLISFLIFYFTLGPLFLSFILSLLAGVAIAGIVAVLQSSRWIRFAVSFADTPNLFSYFIPSIASSCAAAAVNMSLPLILAAYLSSAAVGIFSVYQLGAFGIATVLSTIVITVLAPLSALPERQPGAWKKFFMFAIPLFMASLVVFSISDFLVLKLVGRGYPIRPLWIFLSAAAGGAAILSDAAFTLLGARDARSLWLTVIGSVLAGIVCLGTAFWAVPRYGITGALAAPALAYLAAFLWHASCGLWKLSYNFLK